MSTGYEPTTDNTLSAAVTEVGDMDVDIPYGGGTGSLGGAVTLAPTTPPTTPIQSIIPSALVHHGAPLAAAPFYGGGGSSAIIALPTGSLSQTSTSNQLIPFQVNVNIPTQTGSPGKLELKNEILLLKQQMNQLNMELCNAQITAAQASCNESQFQARAKEIWANFEKTAEEAKSMWSEAHEVSMGMQKAEGQKEYNALKDEANMRITKLTDKLEETQRKAREFQESKEQEFQAKSLRWEQEVKKREVELTTTAQTHFDQQQASHYQEVQAKNL